MHFDFTPVHLLRPAPQHFSRLWLLLGALLVAVVIYVSVLPVPEVAMGVMSHDKLIHLSVYLLLMSWFAQIYRHDLTRLLLAVALVVMGIGIEFWQGTTPSRLFDPFDMLANTCGVILAWALAYTPFGSLLQSFDRWLAVSLRTADDRA